MTLISKLKTGIIAASLMLLGTLSTTDAQTTAEMINNSDNSVVFRIENLDKEITPTKILLVYDSNLITLETTSTKANMFRTSASSTSSVSHFSAASALASSLAVDMEKERDVEDWMLQPFETVADNKLNLAADTEEDIDIEPWMTDLNKW